MPKTAFLCPGAGAQKLGMGVDLVQNAPEASELFQKIAECSGLELFNLCAVGPLEELSAPQNVHPCLFAASLCAAYLLRKRGLEPDCVAGYGIGEYAAHVIAESLDVQTAAQLVSRRGALSAFVLRKKTGALAHLYSCTHEQAAALCDEHANKTGQLLAVSAYDSPGKLALSGERDALLSACQSWRASGGKCTMFEDMGPLNCSLMKDLRRSMQPALYGSLYQMPHRVLYANLSAAPIESADEVASTLVDQIVSPILWEQTINAMLDDGVERFIECGPSSTLSDTVISCAREHKKAAELICVATLDDVEVALASA